MKEYLDRRIEKSLDDGVTHVAEEFSKRFKDFSCVTTDDLVKWLQEVEQNMEKAEKFSIEHTYWWSFKSHLTDIIRHA